MLIHRHDEPLSDAEWHAFLSDHDFGELIAPGVGRDLPIVVPTISSTTAIRPCCCI